MGNPRSIRFNEEKETDMIEFFNDKGLKNGIRYLYTYYKTTSDLKDYIDNKLGNVKSVPVEPKNSVKDISSNGKNFMSKMSFK